MPALTESDACYNCPPGAYCYNKCFCKNCPERTKCPGEEDCLYDDKHKDRREVRK